MSWSDERIAAGLAELDPVSSIDTTPTGSDWARLRRITAEPTSVRRPRLAWAVPVAASLALVVALAITAVVAPPQQALAATPPPLLVDPLTQSTSSFLDESVRLLDAQPDGRARREGQLVHWQYGQSDDEQPVIVPARYVWERDANGQGSLVITADEPYSVLVDGVIVAPAGPAPEPGSEIDPAQASAHLGVFPTLPPSDPDGLAAALRDAVALPPSPDATDYWGAFRVLLSEWTVTPAHHAAMLQLIERAGGTELLGTVTDRLGRNGIALRLPASGVRPFGVTVVLDGETRRIIAADVVYTGGDRRLDLPVGSVVEYSAWVADER